MDRTGGGTEREEALFTWAAEGHTAHGDASVPCLVCMQIVHLFSLSLFLCCSPLGVLSLSLSLCRATNSQTDRQADTHREREVSQASRQQTEGTRQRINPDPICLSTPRSVIDRIHVMASLHLPFSALPSVRPFVHSLVHSFLVPDSPYTLLFSSLHLPSLSLLPFHPLHSLTPASSS